ncbi:MAG: penicillin-binding protein 2 [Herpetosiphon sp.]
MRNTIRVVTVGGGLALIGVGLWQRSDAMWLVLLWSGSISLMVGARLSLQNLKKGVQRGVLNLALVFSLLFVMLTGQLLRTQFVQANQIYNKVVKGKDGNVGNSRPVTRSLKVRRGGIFDRRGVQLAGSQAAPRGYAKRTYPVAEKFDIRAFSNVLGYTSPTYGQDGLEAQWNDYLTGVRGQAILSLEDDLLNRPHQGDDMQLTIDARLQAAVWRIMTEKGAGRPGTAIVIEPKTGALLALVSTPGYDPQALTFDPFAPDWDVMGQHIAQYWRQLNQDPQSPLLNRTLQGRYPPGSTYKTITAIASLMHPEVLRDPKPIDCPNEYKPDPNSPPVVNAVGPPIHPEQPPLEQIIRDQMGGKVDLSGLYAFSCNTAFAQLGVRLGRDNITTVSRQFGFFPPREAEKIDRSPDMTDLPTEVSLLAVRGTFLDQANAVADTAYGQGQLFVTPLQMALIASTIANDGVMMQPYLVEKITDPEHATAYTHPTKQKRIIPSPIASQMRQLMQSGVVTGYGKAAAVAGQTVGGKSGSAQAGKGSNPNEIVHAWFIAIAPVEQPRYAVAVMVENGRDGAGLGAATAGAVLQAAFSLEK